MEYYTEESPNLDTVPAVIYGIKGEPLARMCFLHNSTYEGTRIFYEHLQVGLVVKNKFSFLGASPDGLIRDKSGRRPGFGIVEFKCLFSFKDLPIINPPCLEKIVLPSQLWKLDGHELRDEEGIWKSHELWNFKTKDHVLWDFKKPKDELIYIENIANKKVLGASINGEVILEDFEEGKDQQLWKKGKPNARGYFTLENAKVPKIMTATSSTLQIKYYKDGPLKKSNEWYTQIQVFITVNNSKVKFHVSKR